VSNDVPVSQIESRTGYRFNDAGLVRLALRHASVAENRVASNERLEFLGDAVLGLITCQRIFELFPEMLEGEMTKIKSSVVSRQTCAELAQQIGIAQHLVLGKGMRASPAGVPMSLAAAALECIVAAIYLDGGLEPARRFLLPLIEPRIRSAERSKHQENYKSLLQHYAQQQRGLSPVYVVLEAKGPDHAKHFCVAVKLGEQQFESSWGVSKKHAEQNAAMLALRALGVLNGEQVDLRGSAGNAGGTNAEGSTSVDGANATDATPNHADEADGSDAQTKSA
jgi:ribonuclease-3